MPIRTCIWIVIVSLSGILTANPEEGKPQAITGTIKGRVVTEEGNPVCGAEIYVFKGEAYNSSGERFERKLNLYKVVTTQEDGSFSVAVPAEDSYNLDVKFTPEKVKELPKPPTIEISGLNKTFDFSIRPFLKVDIPFYVKPRSTVDIGEIRIVRRGVKFVMRVRDSRTLRPIWARVISYRLYEHNPPVWFWKGGMRGAPCTTDHQGLYEVLRLWEKGDRIAIVVTDYEHYFHMGIVEVKDAWTVIEYPQKGMDLLLPKLSMPTFEFSIPDSLWQEAAGDDGALYLCLWNLGIVRKFYGYEEPLVLFPPMKSFLIKRGQRRNIKHVPGVDYLYVLRLGKRKLYQGFQPGEGVLSFLSCKDNVQPTFAPAGEKTEQDKLAQVEGTLRISALGMTFEEIVKVISQATGADVKSIAPEYGIYFLPRIKVSKKNAYLLRGKEQHVKSLGESCYALLSYWPNAKVVYGLKPPTYRVEGLQPGRYLCLVARFGKYMLSEPEQEEVWRIRKLDKGISAAFVAGEITLHAGAKLRFDISHDIGIDELNFNAGGFPPSLIQACVDLMRKRFQILKTRASDQTR